MTLRQRLRARPAALLKQSEKRGLSALCILMFGHGCVFPIYKLNKNVDLNTLRQYLSDHHSAINYDEKDPFLCHACGFCKYAKFDYTLTARPCCAVDTIENDEERKKMVQTIGALLDRADRVYRQLVANKPVLEVSDVKSQGSSCVCVYCLLCVSIRAFNALPPQSSKIVTLALFAYNLTLILHHHHHL